MFLYSSSHSSRAFLTHTGLEWSYSSQMKRYWGPFESHQNTLLDLLLLRHVKFESASVKIKTQFETFLNNVGLDVTYICQIKRIFGHLRAIKKDFWTFWYLSRSIWTCVYQKNIIWTFFRVAPGNLGCLTSIKTQF